MTTTMKAFKVVEMPAFKVVGRATQVTMGMPNGNPIPPLWNKCFEDGTMATLEKLPSRIFPNATLGWMGGFNMQAGTFTYIAGVAAQPGSPAEGYEVAETPAAKFAVITVVGPDPEIFGQAHALLEAELKARNLSFNEAVGVEIEWYGERFMADPALREIDLLMSVK